MNEFIADNPRLAFPLAVLVSGLCGATLMVIAWRSRQHPVRSLAGALLGIGFLVLAWRVVSYRNRSYVFELQDRTGSDVSSYTFRTVRDGVEHQLSEFRGKPILLYLWGTYCGPCRSSLPVLARLAVDLDGRAVVVVLSTEDREILLRYSERKEIPGIAAYSSEPPVSSGSGWPRPTFFLIDAKGVVQRVMVGSRSGAHLRELVENPHY